MTPTGIAETVPEALLPSTFRAAASTVRALPSTVRTVPLAAAWSAVVLTAVVSCSSGPGDAVPEPADAVASLVLEVSVGDVPEAGPDSQFAGIADLLATEHGRIWVVDGRVSIMPRGMMVRLYDAGGAFRRRVGRDGEGPGEYRLPYALALTRDGRVALRDDALSNRITFYTTDGTLDTTWILGESLRYTVGGRAELQFDTAGILWLPRILRPGPDRPPPIFLRYREDGSLLDTIPYPPVPEVERRQVEVTRQGRSSTVGFAVPYDPWGTWAWSPSGTFAVARTDRYRIEVLPAPGHVTDGDDAAAPTGAPSIIGRDLPPIPVPQAERAAARQRLAEEASAVAGHPVSIPEIPETKPPIRGMRYGEDGRLWVWVSMPSHERDGEWYEPTAYDVFDPDGRFIARVPFPDSFDPTWLKGDQALGVHRDGLGVESIRRYRIVWPS